MADTNRAYAALREAILAQEFRPEDHLDIRSLATHLSVSSTPVREALIRLFAEGLIDFQANRGFRTKPLDVREWRETLELSLHILLEAVRSPTEPLSMGPLRRPNVAATEGGDSIARVCAEFLEGFYERVARMSSNDVAVATVVSCNEHTRLLRVIDLESSERVRATEAEISLIVQKLAESDTETAERELKAHFQTYIEAIPRLVGRAAIRFFAAGGDRAAGAARMLALSVDSASRPEHALVDKIELNGTRPDR